MYVFDHKISRESLHQTWLRLEDHSARPSDKMLTSSESRQLKRLLRREVSSCTAIGHMSTCATAALKHV